MPPKRRSTYKDRVAKRRPVSESNTSVPPVSGGTDVRPHPSDLQPAAKGLIPQEMVATLSKAISAAVTQALQASSGPVQHTPSSQIQFVPDIERNSTSPGQPTSGSNCTPPPTVNPVTGDTLPTVAENAVQQAVTESVERITGNLLSPVVSSPSSKNTFLSAAIPLAHKLSDKTKKQIWANEYVNFGVLSNSSINTPDDHYTFKIEKSEGGLPALTLAPNPKNQGVQTIEQWLTAFQTFVAVYAEKAPQKTPALMKYGARGRGGDFTMKILGS